jgi:hypothetical protein
VRSDADGSHAAAPWPDLASDVGFDAPGYHRAREDYGEQEKLDAISMDGSGEATTARWWPRPRVGRSGALGGTAVMA